MQNQKKFIVQVEHCQNCYLHNWCSRHDQTKYDDHFHKVKANAESIFSNVEVYRNRPSATFDKIGQLGFKGQTKYFDLKSQQIVHFPRFGAFQIYVNGNLIFSKIQSNLWPKHDRIAKIFTDILNESEQSGNIQKFSLQYRLKNDHEEYFVDTYKKIIKRQFSINRRPLSQNNSQNTYSQYGDGSQVKKGNFISRKVYQSASKKTEQNLSRSRKQQNKRQAEYLQYEIGKRPQTNLNPKREQIIYKNRNSQQNLKRQLQRENAKTASQNSSKFKGSPIRTKLKILKQAPPLKLVSKSPQNQHKIKKGGRRILRNNMVKQQTQQRLTADKQLKPIIKQEHKINNFMKNQKNKQNPVNYQRQRDMSDKQFAEQIKRIDDESENQFKEHQEMQQNTEKTVQILQRKMRSSKQQESQKFQQRNQQKKVQTQKHNQEHKSKKLVSQNSQNSENIEEENPYEQTYQDLIRQENNNQEMNEEYQRNKSPSIDQMVEQSKKSQQKVQNVFSRIQSKKSQIPAQKSSKINGWNSSGHQDVITENNFENYNYAQEQLQQNYDQSYNQKSKGNVNVNVNTNKNTNANSTNNNHPKIQYKSKIVQQVKQKSKVSASQPLVQEKINKDKFYVKQQQKKQTQKVQQIQIQQDYQFQDQQVENDKKELSSYLTNTEDKIIAKMTRQQPKQQQKITDLNKNTVLTSQFKQNEQIIDKTSELPLKQQQNSDRQEEMYYEQNLQEQIPNQSKQYNEYNQKQGIQIDLDERPQSRDSRQSSRRKLNTISPKQHEKQQEKQENNFNPSNVTVQQHLNNNSSAFKKQKTVQLQNDSLNKAPQNQQALQQNIENSKEEYEDLYEDQNEDSQSIPIIVSKQDGSSKIIQQGIQKDYQKVNKYQEQFVEELKEQDLNVNEKIEVIQQIVHQKSKNKIDDLREEELNVNEKVEVIDEISIEKQDNRKVQQLQQQIVQNQTAIKEQNSEKTQNKQQEPENKPASISIKSEKQLQDLQIQKIQQKQQTAVIQTLQQNLKQQKNDYQEKFVEQEEYQQVSNKQQMEQLKKQLQLQQNIQQEEVSVPVQKQLQTKIQNKTKAIQRWANEQPQIDDNVQQVQTIQNISQQQGQAIQNVVQRQGQAVQSIVSQESLKSQKSHSKLSTNKEIVQNYLNQMQDQIVQQNKQIQEQSKTPYQQVKAKQVGNQQKQKQKQKQKAHQTAQQMKILAKEEEFNNQKHQLKQNNVSDEVSTIKQTKHLQTIQGEVKQQKTIHLTGHVQQKVKGQKHDLIENKQHEENTKSISHQQAVKQPNHQQKQTIVQEQKHQNQQHFQQVNQQTNQLSLLSDNLSHLKQQQKSQTLRRGDTQISTNKQIVNQYVNQISQKVQIKHLNEQDQIQNSPQEVKDKSKVQVSSDFIVQDKQQLGKVLHLLKEEGQQKRSQTNINQKLIQVEQNHNQNIDIKASQVQASIEQNNQDQSFLRQGTNITTNKQIVNQYMNQISDNMQERLMHINESQDIKTENNLNQKIDAAQQKQSGNIHANILKQQELNHVNKQQNQNGQLQVHNIQNISSQKQKQIQQEVRSQQHIQEKVETEEIIQADAKQSVKQDKAKQKHYQSQVNQQKMQDQIKVNSNSNIDIKQTNDHKDSQTQHQNKDQPSKKLNLMSKIQQHIHIETQQNPSLKSDQLSLNQNKNLQLKEQKIIVQQSRLSQQVTPKNSQSLTQQIQKEVQKVEEQEKQTDNNQNNSIYDQRFDDINLGVTSKKEVQIHPIKQQQTKDVQEQIKPIQVQQNDYQRTDSKITTNKEIVQSYVQQVNQKVLKYEPHQQKKEQAKIQKQETIKSQVKKESNVLENEDQYNRIDSKVTTNKEIVGQYIKQVNQKIEHGAQDIKPKVVETQIQNNEEEKEAKQVPRLMNSFKNNIVIESPQI